MTPNRFRTALQSAPLDPHDLWMAYAALGGRQLPEQVAELLRGTSAGWPSLELDILAAAMVERLQAQEV